MVTYTLRKLKGYLYSSRLQTRDIGLVGRLGGGGVNPVLE